MWRAGENFNQMQQKVNRMVERGSMVYREVLWKAISLCTEMARTRPLFQDHLLGIKVIHFKVLRSKYFAARSQ